MNLRDSRLWQPCYFSDKFWKGNNWHADERRLMDLGLGIWSLVFGIWDSRLWQPRYFFDDFCEGVFCEVFNRTVLWKIRFKKF